MDISLIKGESYGGAKSWALILDDCSDYCWSFFLRSKIELKNKVIEVIKELKGMDKAISFIRCDDAGENKSLESLSKHLSSEYSLSFQDQGLLRGVEELKGTYKLFLFE